MVKIFFFNYFFVHHTMSVKVLFYIVANVFSGKEHLYFVCFVITNVLILYPLETEVKLV